MTLARLPVLVFDVNETLLDLESLTPLFTRIFGNGSVMREWFAQLILYSEALTLVGEYAAFGELGGAVLKMMGATRHTTVTDAEVLALKRAIASMPCHPDVPGALSRLRQVGFRLFTLTNNPAATATRQLERAGLTQYFEQQFSIDTRARRYKPAPDTYRFVEHELGLTSANCCMIACHTWDTLGAVAAGWEAALVLRPGNAPLMVGPQAQITGENLAVIADSLIARYASPGHHA
jgi:2-haloacid dehalogenase